MYLPVLRLDFVTVIIREKDQAVVGFAVSMPSMSQALRRCKGKMFPLGFLHLLKALKSQPKVVDLYLMGVLPEYQNKGINALLFNDLIPIFNESGVVYAESNPELETNMSVQLQWNYFERKHHKTRRAFIKKI
jgi:GNAT superfamily N-acetyltransferase